MAGKTLTDLGSGDSGIVLNRSAGNSFASVEVRSADSNGRRAAEAIELTAAEVLAAVPATALPNGTTLRAAFIQAYDAIYAAGLAKGHYV